MLRRCLLPDVRAVMPSHGFSRQAPVASEGCGQLHVCVVGMAKLSVDDDASCIIKHAYQACLLQYAVYA